jgi:AcrR family transcriptional regulator
MPETPYHHGNLRLALLEAARLLALEQPIDNITLREVARRAGVSHAAPYHHFADKRALLKALALEAFKELLRIQQAQVQPDPNATLYNIGLAYVRFALAHPTEFGFMFRKSLCEPVGVYDEQGLVCWSAIHGLATLLIEAPVLPTPPTSEQLEGLMQLHSHTLNFGLFALNKA